MSKMVKYIKQNYRNGLNPLYNCILFWRRHVSLNGKVKIRGRIVCKRNGNGKIVFGKDCVINSAKWANIIGGDTRTAFIVNNGAVIRIGNNVGISNSTLVASKEIVIEDNVMIGGNCKIYDTDFHSIDYQQRMEKPDTHIKKAPILIQKGAFIGAHSIILKGVTIGEKSVIGAGSVVTKSVPDNEIWAGNPAHFIRKVK